MGLVALLPRPPRPALAPREAHPRIAPLGVALAHRVGPGRLRRVRGGIYPPVPQTARRDRAAPDARALARPLAPGRTRASARRADPGRRIPHRAEERPLRGTSGER